MMMNTATNANINSTKRVSMLCVVSLLFGCVAAAPMAIYWHTEDRVYWAHGCDFYGDDMGGVSTPADMCGPQCEKTPDCTHFTWSEWNGGTCWLKSSTTVTKADAFSIDQPNAVCGILRHTAASAPVVCNEKRVRIYKFCINGNDDSGANGEHQIRLDGQRYYPHNENDCPQGPSGYCSWREGQCHNLHNAAWIPIHHAHSITVGTEEHDSTSQNDSYFADLAASEWHSPTCAPYEVRIAKPFKPEIQKSLCWEAGVSVTVGNEVVQGELNAGVTSCSEWTQPAESYVWFLTVEPEQM